MLVFYFSFIFSFDLNHEYYIQTSDDPHKNLVFDGSEVHLKQKTSEELLNMSDNSKFTLIPQDDLEKKDQYKIKTKTHYLIKKDPESLLTLTNLELIEKLGVWTIGEKKSGFYQISQDGMCLAEDLYDENEKVYNLSLVICDENDDKQNFKFEKVGIVVDKDGSILLKIDDGSDIAVGKHANVAGFDLFANTKGKNDPSMNTMKRNSLSV